MRLIKPDNYQPVEMYLSQIAHALSHPFRRRIIQLLMSGEISSRVEILRRTKLSKVAVYNHGEILINADLIEKNYQVHFEVLQLNYRALLEMKNYLEDFFDNRKK